MEENIQVFKALSISKPVNIPTMHYFSDTTLNDLQNLHKKSIGGGKRPKIKHCTPIGDYEEGGLKDVDIEAKFSALKKKKDPTMFDPLGKKMKPIF